MQHFLKLLLRVAFTRTEARVLNYQNKLDWKTGSICAANRAGMA